jgi:hypothetical protein
LRAPRSYPESSSIQPLRPSRSSPLAGSAGGTLRLDVDPTAQAYVDGFYAGTVADLNDGGGLTLTAGWHRLEFRVPGYHTAAANVTIDAGRTVTYHLALQPILP